MNDLALVSTRLWELFRGAAVPDELAEGTALRCAVDERRCVQLRFQPLQQRWLLGADQGVELQDEDDQARSQEALLRVAHASRWTAQQVGALDAEGRICLVDCDFPGSLEQAALLAGPDLIEERLRALLHQLEALCAPTAAAAASAQDPTENALNSWLKA